MENNLHPLSFPTYHGEAGWPYMITVMYILLTYTRLLTCTFYLRPTHLTGKNELPDCTLCLSTAVAQNCFPFISFCRTVRGPLDHGDAQRVQQQWLGRPHHHLHHLRGICSADGSHPACHGGALSLSARLASALVGGVVFWSFSWSSLWEASGCGDRWPQKLALDMLH